MENFLSISGVITRLISVIGLKVVIGEKKTLQAVFISRIKTAIINRVFINPRINLFGQNGAE